MQSQPKKVYPKQTKAEREQRRQQNVVLMALSHTDPDVDQLFEAQAKKRWGDGEAIKRLRTAQCHWLEERRNNKTPPVDPNDEFAQEKQQYLSMGNYAITTQPAVDGNGLITMRANGMATLSDLADKPPPGDPDPHEELLRHMEKHRLRAIANGVRIRTVKPKA